MNTITIYTTTEDLKSKMVTIQVISQVNTIGAVEQLKEKYKVFDVYLTNTNKYDDRVAFNLDFSTFSLLSIFIGGNFLTD